MEPMVALQGRDDRAALILASTQISRGRRPIERIEHMNRATRSTARRKRRAQEKE
jgi:hypothetical protein